MKVVCISLLIALALLLSTGSGRSDEKHQYQSRPDYRSASHKAKPSPSPTPLTIIIQPAPVHIIESSTTIEEQKPHQKWYQRPTFTDWGILGVTILYTVISLGLLNATRKQAQLAKGSAKLAKRALTELEIPYVSIGEIVPHVLWKPGEDKERPSGPHLYAVAWFEYGFRNSGRSFAEITAVHGELCVLTVLPMPPDYRGTVDESAFPIGPSSDTGKFRWTVRHKFAGDLNDEWGSLSSDKTRLVCFGYVRYRDAFNTKWISGFGWQWNPNTDSVYLVGGRRYNYTRKDEPYTGLSEPE